MKSFKNYSLIFLAVVALSVSSTSAQSFASSGSARSIDEQVRKKILKLPRYEVFDAINYQVTGDTVTLTGKVRNAVNKDDAERSVKRIAGVNRVINRIEVLPVGSFDEDIRVRLYYTLARSGALSRYLWTTNPSVRLIVDRGHVSLEGYVSTRGDYNTMNVLAHGVPGVFSVTNNLVVDKERLR